MHHSYHSLLKQLVNKPIVPHLAVAQSACACVHVCAGTFDAKFFKKIHMGHIAFRLNLTWFALLQALTVVLILDGHMFLFSV